MKRPNNRNHRIAWERAHGKKLEPGSHVHHLDGNPFNNSPENLIALTAKEHYDIHFEQGDYAACILLSKSANITSDELSNVQRLHGLKCVDRGIGFHSASFDRRTHLENIWKLYRPGRKPVTDGELIFKLKTDKDVELFLNENPTWRKGVPEKTKRGLSMSNKRLTSEEAKKISKDRIDQGTHNFLTSYVCPHCNKSGKGPMMKRWHFDNCKYSNLDSFKHSQAY
jgi:hypothetical protein